MKNHEAKTGVPLVQSLQRALHILKCFTENKNALTLSEISEKAGLHKSTTHRLLNTLIEENFIRKVDDFYMLDWIFLELSATLTASGGYKKVIHEGLERIVQQTKETAHAGIIYNDKVLYIDKVESNYSLRLQSYIGKLADLHSTGLGKVILAYLDNEQLHALLYRLELSKHTTNTITNHDQLLKEVLIIRKKGFAIDDEENENGLICLAVPFLGNDGHNYGAISISGPVSRIKGNIDKYIQILQYETSRITKLLGDQISLLTDLNNF